MPQDTLKQKILRETALFIGLFFLGLVVAPIAIYIIGPRLLGEFGGHGYGDFFGTLGGKIRSGDLTAWFLVLSPWLVWQVLRLTLYGWRRSGKT